MESGQTPTRDENLALPSQPVLTQRQQHLGYLEQ